LRWLRGLDVVYAEEGEADEFGDRSPTGLVLGQEENLPQASTLTSGGLAMLYGHICACLGEADGNRYFVVVILHVVEGNQLQEICVWLATPPADMQRYWETVHGHRQLPAAIPPQWATICGWFGPPFTLTQENLRQWYRRRTRKLAGGLGTAPPAA
jgi:hypothetical protein